MTFTKSLFHYEILAKNRKTLSESNLSWKRKSYLKNRKPDISIFSLFIIFTIHSCTEITFYLLNFYQNITRGKYLRKFVWIISKGLRANWYFQCYWDWKNRGRCLHINSAPTLISFQGIIHLVRKSGGNKC